MTENIGITKTRLGVIGVVEEDDAIIRLDWNAENSGHRSGVIKEALRQVEAYFAGDLMMFDLPLRPEGSLFQQLVYREMQRIPSGETRSYGDIAKELDANPQAVGQACGSNPIPIIIPCHRVVAADGLGGYSGAGGVESKVWLLRHEGAASLLI